MANTLKFQNIVNFNQCGKNVQYFAGFHVKANQGLKENTWLQNAVNISACPVAYFHTIGRCTHGIIDTR